MQRLELTPSQRDALYEDVVDHLGGLEDLRLALEGDDSAQAERLAQGFSDDLLFLLHDLGFGAGSQVGTLELTTPPEVLRRLLHRLRDRVEQAEWAEAQERADLRAAEIHNQLVRETCGALLSRLEGAE